ncbi:hypothetical protein KP509_1Z152800 [Ceratopteris richardii]|nr:hypothetical protein KP509_1Z152800 [Ceratopteris richardii]
MDEGNISQHSIGVPWNEQDEKTGTQAEEASLHLRNVQELGKGVDPIWHNLPAERISNNPADEVAQNQMLLQGSDRVQKELSHELMKDGGSQDIGDSVNACYPFQAPASSCFEISKLCSNEEDSVAFGSLASTSSDKREAAIAFQSGNFIENSDYRCSQLHLCEIDGNPNMGNISESTSKSSCVADDENDSALCCQVNISKDEDRGDSLSTGIMKCTTEKIDSSRDQCCRVFNEDANGEDCTINGNVAISGSVRGNKSRGADEGYVPAAASSDLPDSLCVTHMGLQTNKMEKGIKIDHVHVDPLGTETHANDNVLSPSMDNLISSDRQDHGYTDYKNSHSSLDSTAGTEFQHSNRYKFMEDEETRTDREDPVGSVTSTQSVVQQRKKINIHHQFVREIVKIQHDREIYDREQAERQAHVQQAAGSPQVGDKVSHIKAKSQQIGISQPGSNSSYNKASGSSSI